MIRSSGQPAPVVANAAGTAPQSIFDKELDLNGWKEVKGNFVCFNACNTPWQASDMCFAPYSSINDGAIDLSWVMAGVKSSQLLSILLDATKPPMDKDFFSYAKARAFMLEPHDLTKGHVDIDGEEIPRKAVSVENHCGLARILAPAGLDMREMEISELPEAGLNTQDVVELKGPTGAPQATVGAGAQTTAATTGAPHATVGAGAQTTAATAGANQAPKQTVSQVMERSPPKSNVSMDRQNNDASDRHSVVNTTLQGSRGMSKAFIREHGVEENIRETYAGVPTPGKRDQTEKLGAGGTASVYKIVHRKTKQEYALKVVNLYRIEQKKRDMLLREIEIIKLLDHPNTIKVVEVFQSLNTMYIVMELCTGEELFDRLYDQPGDRFTER